MWQRVLLLVEMMSSGLGGQLHLPCVANQTTSTLVASIKDLYLLRRTDEDLRSMVDSLIDQSLDNWYARVACHTWIMLLYSRDSMP